MDVFTITRNCLCTFDSMYRQLKYCVSERGLTDFVQELVKAVLVHP